MGAVSQAVHTPVHAVSQVPVAAVAAGYAAAPAVAAGYAAAPIAAGAYALNGAYAAAPAATISKYLSKVIGLCPWRTVSPPPLPPTSSRWTWWLLILSCWNTSNVLVMLLQYDITYSNIKTSGTSFVVMLNVLFVRYRRELFINKS